MKFVYQHPELHEEDSVKEYRKVETFVSINPDRAAIEGEYAEREKSLLSRVERAESPLAELWSVPASFWAGSGNSRSSTTH